MPEERVGVPLPYMFFRFPGYFDESELAHLSTKFSFLTIEPMPISFLPGE